MKVFSMFSGIGGFDLAMRNLGHEIVGACEIDKYARQIYAKQFPGVPIHTDATQVSAVALPSFDVLCAGFPCQSFSIAGKRRGFSDTRGSLFFEIARIAKEKQPSILFLENVKGLLSHDKGETFRTILSSLDEVGYSVEWQLFNSKHFVPQNRERVFLVCHLRGKRARQVLPLGRIDEKTTKKQITSKPDNNIPVVNDRGELREVERATCLDASYYKGHDFHGARTMIMAWSSSGRDGFRETRIKLGECNTLNTGDGCRGQSTANYVALTERRTDEAKAIRKESMATDGVDWSPRRGKELVKRDDDLANCVTTGQTKESLITDGVKIRKLTPVECERLQGFPEIENFINLNIHNNTWSLEHQRKHVDVVNKNHKLPNVVGNVENDKLLENVKYVEKHFPSEDQQKNKHAQLTVHIFCVDNKIVSFKTKKSLSSVNNVEDQNLSLQHLENVISVPQIVGINTILEKITHNGKEESRQNDQCLTLQKNGKMCVNLSGKEIMQHVQDAKTDSTILKKLSRSIIKNHSSLNNTDYNQVTSYLSAIHAISGYIQKEMQNENSLNFQIYHRTGWTEGISDTQRYKCCGNAVTVPVVQWIASHFEFPKDLA